MENLSDTFLTVLLAVSALMVINMHLRIKSLEKKLGS